MRTWTEDEDRSEVAIWLGDFKTEEEFKEAIAKMDVTETTIRTQLEKGLAIDKLLKTKVVKDIAVTEEESRKYYDEHQDQFLGAVGAEDENPLDVTGKFGKAQVAVGVGEHAIGNWFGRPCAAGEDMTGPVVLKWSGWGDQSLSQPREFLLS